MIARQLAEIQWNEATKLVWRVDADGFEPGPTPADIGAAWSFAYSLRLYGEAIVELADRVTDPLPRLGELRTLAERKEA